jgi:aldehyde:ferredoxin oxidoreductase
MALAHIHLGSGDRPRPARRIRQPYADGGPLEALRLVLDWVTETRGPTSDAPVAVVAGPVAGVAGPGLARTTAIGLSPLSGGIGETRAEGPFAAGLRGAGVTGVVLHGRAPVPVVVVVSGGEARTEPCTLWGLDTDAATDELHRIYGADASVAVIGPAGEIGVKYASIVTCRDHPLSRLGFGAVLGHKRVKAIVCTGSDAPAVADPAALARIADGYANRMLTNELTAWQHGSPGFAVWQSEPGYAPVANFADTRSRGGVDPATAPPLERVAACPGCPTGCMKVYAGGALSQEALAALGPNIGVDDPWTLHTRCVRAGVDPVSFAGTVAAAGVPSSAVTQALKGLVNGHDPYGLAIGAGRLAAAGRARRPAMTSKDVELPPFDPRVQPNLGLAYAVNPIGPRYDAVEHDLDFMPDGGMPWSFDEVRRLGVTVPRPLGTLDPAGTAALMRLWSGLDALGVCLFASTPTRPLLLADVTDLVAAITGAAPDVVALGAQRLTWQREINHRLGIGLDRDTLPDRFFTEPIAAGPYAGAVLDRVAFTEAISTLQCELGFRTGNTASRT